MNEVYEDWEDIVLSSDQTVIKIYHEGSYIKKTINDEQLSWPDVLRQFIDMLCGCGYIIDQVKAADLIDKIDIENQKGEW